MASNNRRDFLKSVGALGAAAALPTSIDRAFAVPARRVTGTIKDVKHIVILMQENRSFDHYFGTMKGVRGFGDRHTVPLPGNRTIWQQHNGARVRPPFWLDTAKTSAMRVPDTPHTYPDTQAAWNQGSFGAWPKFKSDYAMGFYRRSDIPFQFALAEAFTVCDAYHCSLMTCTDPNRIVFWSGSNFDPRERARGVNCRENRAEIYNVRCHVKGAMPDPGYSYGGDAFEWETIPEVLEKNGIGWRIYQNPNDNCSGLFHGGLAFKGFRDSRPGDPLYERGMRHWSLDDLARDVREGTLPAVSWILPPADWSEHPSASTPIEGAEYTARILDALTANPDVWASTVFFLNFDENDGFFDHMPPPAPPSFNKDGTVAGKATFDLAGEYYDDHDGKWTLPEDNVTGKVRPWGLGPRVPMVVVSPWSKGGWVNSETFDHTGIGRFLEKRFDINVPAISPWHRKMCGDLTSCFDFSMDADRNFPPLPDARGSRAALAEQMQHFPIIPHFQSKGMLTQEQGLRRSRALPYRLHVDARTRQGAVTLTFVNDGTVGATFHVYDKQNLDRIPRRYCVEAGKTLDDQWSIGENGFDLVVLGSNGFMRSFRAPLRTEVPALVARYDSRRKEIALTIDHVGTNPLDVIMAEDRYAVNEPLRIGITAGSRAKARWSAEKSHGWYDFTVTAGNFVMCLAGRIEDGKPSVSDPLMHV
ncbi:phosphocholine-specific phospholipase C [Polymorphobacter fuscus]|uniref:phospholipase C n=1 Tax=Sandarakinorhabdus fusca TaxID=1439888 RepID=A0A7C9GUW0_9SPHN|nr:phospholipase C, phosphocholine-specific [Polymorphobacter fuscus]KAB7647663.1 phospholipase C, phosphocholine-specific [Polymorphobacter fuscus]MQT16949.1 phospholipase C, phosphocholine-specific [Polymorphobacter fuscus]NJC09061.1 phospholipase C [Polymorphobacter fuscus]